MGQIWEHAGEKFEYVSYYCVPEDAWHHEVTGLDAQAYACVVVPDATPGAAFLHAPFVGEGHPGPQGRQLSVANLGEVSICCSGVRRPGL